MQACVEAAQDHVLIHDTDVLHQISLQRVQSTSEVTGAELNDTLFMSTKGNQSDSLPVFVIWQLVVLQFHVVISSGE